MSSDLKSASSVVNFSIEGVGQGAEHSHPVRSVPPRLPGSQSTSLSMSVHSFSVNPFSLSRSSFSNLHDPLSVSKSSVVNVSSTVPSLTLLPSPPARSLFPNPFLLKVKSDSHTASDSSLAVQSLIDNPKHFILPPAVQPTQCSSNSSTSALPAVISSFSSSSTRRPRKPRPDRNLAPSIFRPHVMAADRLFSWRTPYGLAHDQSLLAELPPALVNSAKMSITGALASSSRSSYGAGLLRFNQFCDRWEISERSCMPASYALLCAFIGNYKGSSSGKTIKAWLSGIRAWHLANHAPWFGDDKCVQMARISANKEGTRHKHPLRAPVSIEHLLALRRALSLSNHFHPAIWAVALVTFFGCRRLGETVLTSVSSFDPNFHVLRSAEYVFSASLYLSFINLLQCFFCYSTRWITLSFFPDTLDENHS